jgi:hypothetical protein
MTGADVLRYAIAFDLRRSVRGPQEALTGVAEARRPLGYPRRLSEEGDQGGKAALPSPVGRQPLRDRRSLGELEGPDLQRVGPHLRHHHHGRQRTCGRNPRPPLILAPNDYVRWPSDDPDPRDLMRDRPSQRNLGWPPPRTSLRSKLPPLLTLDLSKPLKGNPPCELVDRSDPFFTTFYGPLRGFLQLASLLWLYPIAIHVLDVAGK